MILFQTDELEVAPIDPGDLPALFEVYKQCEDFLALGPVSEASLQMVREDIDRSRSENGQYCAIRNHQGHLIGVLDFSVNGGDDSTSILSLLMIAASWRNKGYGQTVVNALEMYLKETYKIERIASGVQTNNSGAIRFWKRLGYDLSTEPRPMPDGTVTYEMAKVL